MSASLGFEVTLPLGHEDAINRVTELLKTEGFGILSRVDVGNAIESKLGVSFRPYAILGACNPQLAHRALSARPDIGMLLPCNVTIEDVSEGQSKISLVNPDAMMEMGDLGDNPEVRAMADDAKSRLSRVVEALEATNP